MGRKSFFSRKSDLPPLGCFGQHAACRSRGCREKMRKNTPGASTLITDLSGMLPPPSWVCQLVSGLFSLWLSYSILLRHFSTKLFCNPSLQNSSPILFLDTSLHQSSSTLLCNTLLQHVLNSLPLHSFATILLQHFNARLLHFSTTPSYTSL